MPFEKTIKEEEKHNPHHEFHRENEHMNERTNEHAERHEHEEFELVAISPLRRLEKRMEGLEKDSSAFNMKEFYREMVDIIRMNQQLVDELAKANDALRIELSRLPGRIEELVTELKELLSYIKASSTEDQQTPSGQSVAEGMKPIAQKLDVLIDTNKKIVDNNQALLNVLDEMEKRIRPRPPMPPMMRKPMPPSPSTAPQSQKPA